METSWIASQTGTAGHADISSFPIFYDDIRPLSSTLHPHYRYRRLEHLPKLGRANAIPLTIEEFVAAQRHYPIVFSDGDHAVPLALMGLNDGVNTYFDATGRPIHPAYLPAYVRRYPFILARLSGDAEELSLCYDPTSGMVGEGLAGDALFENGAPSPALRAILAFCEEFELAAQRTTAFAARLLALGLLVDGEFALTAGSQPYRYRGFRKVDERRLRALDAATRRQLEESGDWPLVNAHLMSLPLIRDVFERQRRQGRLG